MLIPRQHQRGLSLVELLVGVAIGMFLIGGAISLFVSNIGNSRRMLTEARLSQDLRAAADLITRDLRRAAYWGNAIQSTIATGSGSTTTANPYRTVTTSTSQITYNFSRDTENDTLDDNEQFGFRLSSGVLQMRTSADTWQPVTDPNVLTVTNFAITPTVTEVDVGNTCPTTCTIASSTCPRIRLRQYQLTLTAQSTTDAAVVRRLRTTVKARNDEFFGVCPT